MFHARPKKRSKSSYMRLMIIIVAFICTALESGRAAAVERSLPGCWWFQLLITDEDFQDNNTDYPCGARVWGSVSGRRQTAYFFAGGSFGQTLPTSFGDFRVKVYGFENGIGSGPLVQVVDWEASSITSTQVHFVFSGTLFSCDHDETLNQSNLIAYSTAKDYVYNPALHGSGFQSQLGINAGAVVVVVDAAFTDKYHIRTVYVEATCPFGAIEDCDGNCAPESWIGDGICDDENTTNFDCALFGFDGGDCEPECSISQTSLNFGTVQVSSSSNRTFTITNDGGGTLSGSVSESCSHYSIVSGGGPYNLGAGQSRSVTVRFSPSSSGTKTCTISTGSACASVSGTGIGDPEPPPPGCPTGEIEDCNGNCAPEDWVGDDFCDDGSFSHNGVPIFLNCPEFNNDGGDCEAAGCPSGEIEDCNGNCAPEDWVGDDFCDDGSFSHNGVPIFLNCPEFNNDGGDCEAAGCPSGEIEDCNGNCAPEQWIGDGVCADGTYTHNGVPIYFNCAGLNYDDGDCLTGACCLSSGTCQGELTSLQCSSQGGTYQGNGSNCSSEDCPQPAGACCFSDAPCEILAQVECHDQGGMWQGGDSDCDDCPALGACCLCDGTCIATTPTECANQNGTYQNTSCDAVECPDEGGICGQGCTPMLAPFMFAGLGLMRRRVRRAWRVRRATAAGFA